MRKIGKIRPRTGLLGPETARFGRELREMNMRWTWVMIPVGDEGQAVSYRHAGPLGTLGDSLATRSVWNRLRDDGVPYHLWCVGERSPFGYSEPFSPRGVATVLAWSASAGWLDGPMDGRPLTGRVAFTRVGREAKDGAELAAATLLGVDGEDVPRGTDQRMGVCAGCVAEWRP